jgi:hypothetical protein
VSLPAPLLGRIDPHDVGDDICADRDLDPLTYGGAHCYCHHVDEPGGGYLRCGECFHAYLTPRELRREYRRACGPGWLRRLAAVFTRAGDIWFCPLCAHDF